MFGDIGGFTGATAAATPVSYKIWSIYNKNPQGFINVTNDVIRHPLATWQARKLENILLLHLNNVPTS